MKTLTKLSNTVRSVALALLVSLGGSSLASGATLFTENWSGLEPGDTAASSGRWEMINGAEGQFHVVHNPIPTAGGNALATFHSSTSPNKALPEMYSTERFSLGAQGLSVTFDIALTNVPSGGYLRVGFVSDVDPNQAYWLLLQTNFVAVEKRTAADPNSIVTIKQHRFSEGEMVLNEVNSFTLQITPISETQHQVNMLFNNEIISSSVESGTIPNFGGDLRVIYAVRSAQESLLYGVSVAPIPEGKTAFLLLPAAAGLILFSRRVQGSGFF